MIGLSLTSKGRSKIDTLSSTLRTMPKLLISTLIALLSIFGAPLLASAQSAETTPISVCADENRASSCIQGDNVIQSLYGLGLERTSLGWKIRNGLTVNTVLSKLIREDENLSALFILEEITPDPDNEDNRPLCHACVPRMTIALFNWVNGDWKLLSHTKGLDGIGAWGILNVDDFTLHVTGSQQYLLEIRSAYMTQGITETSSGFYATFDPNGKPSTSLRSLGSVITSVSSCASVFSDSAQESSQLVISFKPQQYPDLILYRTQAGCETSYAKKTLAPQVFVFDKKVNTYSLSNQKK